MLKKLCYLVPIVVLIMVMGTNNARGDVLHWSGNGSPDPNWHVPQNWDVGVVPQGGDDAYCKTNTGKRDPNYVTASSTYGGLCLLCIADVSANGELNIDSGTLNVVSALRASKNSTGPRTAKVNMKGGTLAFHGRGVTVGQCVGNDIVDGALNWGPNGPGETVESTWNMTGGLITCGAFTCPSAGTLSHSTFNLDGGTLIIREESTGFAGGETDVSVGFFVNESLNTDRPNNHYRAGGRGGILNITGGTVIAQGNITPLFDPARYDSEYEVYTGYLYDPCNVVRPYPALAATSYNKFIVYDYDQRNDGKTTITAAAIPVARAWKPDPVKDSLYVPTTPTLKWNGGADATDGHDVYFGTNSASLPYVTTVDAGDPCEYAPSALPLGTKYFWQAVAQPADEADLWEFTVEGKAKGPSPLDGASMETNASRNVTLSWAAGAYATSHDVYFGTDSTSLSLIADNNSANFKRVQGVLGQKNYWQINENSDEDHGPVETSGAPPWSFTMADYDQVDSFESYANYDAFIVVWKESAAMDLDLALNSGRTSRDPTHSNTVKSMEVKYTYASANTGACNALFTTTQNWTSSGSSALDLSFWMRGKGNNSALSNLYIQLATGTTTSSAYYSAKVPISDFNHLLLNDFGTTIDKGDEWMNVNIALNDFNGTGKGASFNLASVRRLFIGSQASGAATGTFWLDDFRLYPSRCVHARDAGSPGAALADITDDCVVNYVDLYKVTDEWLVSDTDVSLAGALKNCKFDGNSVDGVYGKALKLGEPRDWVDIEDLAFPDFSDKTVAMWVRVDERPIPETTRLLIFSASNYWRLNIIAEGDSSNTRLESMVGNEFIEPTISGYVTITGEAEHDWHHIAMTVSPVSAGTVDCTMYVDGGQPITYTVENHFYDQLDGICIGGLNNGLNQHSNITVDDFRIYDRELTESEVLALKNGTPPSADDLLIKYDFDETTGTVAANTGSMSTVHRPVGYTPGVTGAPQFKLSQGELYTGADSGKTYINLKDYAIISKHWLYGNGGTWVYP